MGEGLLGGVGLTGEMDVGQQGGAEKGEDL